MEIPDFIKAEEERLRKLEKQRVAGELGNKHKSASSRSTEEVAKRLSQPQKEIDVGAEIRNANTQAELCRAQRRLANIYRKVEDSADAKAGLGPKLLHVTKWVRAEAAEQRENLAAGKTKDGKEKGKLTVLPASDVWTSSGGTTGGNPDFFSTSCPSQSSGADFKPASAEVKSDDVEFLVECRECEVRLPWEALQSGDGRCVDCCLSMAKSVGSTAGSGDASAGYAPVGCDAPAVHEAALPAELQHAAGRHDVASNKVASAGEPANERRSTWRSRRRTERATGDL